jgi:hypothetical protein
MTGKKGMAWKHRIVKGISIYTIEQKTREIRALRKAQNCIIENCAYHGKNVEEQDEKLSKLGNLTEIEEEVIDKLRNMRHEGAVELTNMIMEYNKKIEGKVNKKETEKKVFNKSMDEDIKRRRKIMKENYKLSDKAMKKET